MVRGLSHLGSGYQLFVNAVGKVYAELFEDLPDRTLHGGFLFHIERGTRGLLRFARALQTTKATSLSKT